MNKEKKLYINDEIFKLKIPKGLTIRLGIKNVNRLKTRPYKTPNGQYNAAQLSIAFYTEPELSHIGDGFKVYDVGIVRDNLAKTNTGIYPIIGRAQIIIGDDEAYAFTDYKIQKKLQEKLDQQRKETTEELSNELQKVAESTTTNENETNKNNKNTQNNQNTASDDDEIIDLIDDIPF